MLHQTRPKRRASSRFLKRPRRDRKRPPPWLDSNLLGRSSHRCGKRTATPSRVDAARSLSRIPPTRIRANPPNETPQEPVRRQYRRPSRTPTNALVERLSGRSERSKKRLRCSSTTTIQLGFSWRNRTTQFTVAAAVRDATAQSGTNDVSWSTRIHAQAGPSAVCLFGATAPHGAFLRRETLSCIRGA